MLMTDPDVRIVIDPTRGYAVARAWGFRPVTLLTWCKESQGIGLGGAYTQTTEFVIFARRGRDVRQRRADTSWWLFSTRDAKGRRNASSVKAGRVPRCRRANQPRSLRRAVRPARPLRLGLLGRPIARHGRDGGSMRPLTQRVQVGSYYTDGAGVYEVVEVDVLGAVNLRNIANDAPRYMGIDAFRRAMWLVAGGQSVAKTAAA